jgi:hypothetical protein
MEDPEVLDHCAARSSLVARSNRCIDRGMVRRGAIRNPLLRKRLSPEVSQFGD